MKKQKREDIQKKLTQAELFWMDFGRSFQMGILGAFVQDARLPFETYEMAFRNILTPFCEKPDPAEYYQAYNHGYDIGHGIRQRELMSIKMSKEMS